MTRSKIRSGYGFFNFLQDIKRNKIKKFKSFYLYKNYFFLASIYRSMPIKRDWTLKEIYFDVILLLLLFFVLISEADNLLTGTLMCKYPQFKTCMKNYSF